MLSPTRNHTKRYPRSCQKANMRKARERSSKNCTLVVESFLMKAAWNDINSTNHNYILKTKTPMGNSHPASRSSYGRLTAKQDDPFRQTELSQTFNLEESLW